MEEWQVYVLRYKATGNYYVGNTPKVKGRMETHWRKTSAKNSSLPAWSEANKSTEGFEYYLFESADQSIMDQSTASDCENNLQKEIWNFIKSEQLANIAVVNDHWLNDSDVDRARLKDYKAPVDGGNKNSSEKIDKFLMGSINKPLALGANNAKFRILLKEKGEIDQYNPNVDNSEREWHPVILWPKKK